jgi:1,4-dihydroxy-2-naphthoyl-CoA hydrolase
MAATLTADELTTGWIAAMGMKLDEMGPDRVELQWTVGPQHLQPFGLVHGGVLAGALETACSIGAVCRAGPDAHVVGMELSTSFLRPARQGVLRCVATPVHVGRSSQLWEAVVTNGDQQLLAVGRVRLAAVPGRGGSQ